MLLAILLMVAGTLVAICCLGGRFAFFILVLAMASTCVCWNRSTEKIATLKESLTSGDWPSKPQINKKGDGLIIEWKTPNTLEKERRIFWIVTELQISKDRNFPDFPFSTYSNKETGYIVTYENTIVTRLKGYATCTTISRNLIDEYEVLQGKIYCRIRYINKLDTFGYKNGTIQPMPWKYSN